MANTTDLVRLLALTPIRAGAFRVERPPSMGGPRLFGGMVVAQALLAAYGTVTDRTCHSLHAYFVSAGNPELPIDYEVESIRDGGSFTTRRVIAMQGGQQILVLLASFQVSEDGPSHQATEQPAVPAAHTLPESTMGRPRSFRDSSEMFALHQMVEMRQVHPRSFENPGIAPPHKSLWLRAPGAAGHSQFAHQIAFAFASDLNLLETAMRPHGLIWTSPGLQSASVDHAIWFHRPMEFSQWHQFSHASPTAHGARGFVRGEVFAEDGTLVASIAQEGLMRVRKQM